MTESKQSYGAIPGDAPRRKSSAPSREDLGRACSRVSLVEISPASPPSSVDIEGGGEPGGPLYSIMAEIMPIMNIVSYVPLVLPSFLSDDLDLAATLATGLSVLTMIVDYLWYKVGGSKIAVKVLSTSLAIAYGSVFLLTRGLLGPSIRDMCLQIAWFNAISNSLIFLCLLLAYKHGHSFVKDALTDSMGEAQLSYPIIMHLESRLEVNWLAAFLGMALAGLTGALFGNEDSSDLFVTLFVDPAYAINIFLGLGFVGMAMYPKHLINTIDEKMEFYKDDIARWEEEHPDAEVPFGME